MKINVIYFVFLIVKASTIFAQSNETKLIGIKIGNQIWSTKNLEVTRFRNGDVIIEAKTQEEWINAGNAGQPAWCYYENKSVNGLTYGKLYNWFAVNDPRGLAPIGWHIPSDKEWTQLTIVLGGEREAGKKLKSKSKWNKDGNGTDEVGFNALPGGSRTSYGEFQETLGGIGAWWASTEWFMVSSQTTSDRPKNTAWIRLIGCCHPDQPNGIIRGNSNKKYGYSVRCIKD